METWRVSFFFFFFWVRPHTDADRDAVQPYLIRACFWGPKCGGKCMIIIMSYIIFFNKEEIENS